MKVKFVEPPAHQRIGGLEGAIRSLERALRQIGVEVVGEDAPESSDQVVHFHGLWQPSHARLSRNLQHADQPFVVSPHGMLERWAWRHKWWKKWPYFFLLERPHLRRAGALLATAPMEKRRLEQMIPGQRVEVLPLGFTGEAKPRYAAARGELGWQPDETVLLFLSRVHVKKGLELLLRGLPTVSSTRPVRLVVVGGGDPGYVEELKQLAAQLRLSRVEFIGEVWGEARWTYFQGADLFCLPSYSENFGLAVLEAYQVGTPVLTSTATPWAEWRPPTGAFIVEPNHEDVARALTRFLSAPAWSEENRSELSAWAHRSFSWDALAPHYSALYQHLSTPGTR